MCSLCAGCIVIIPSLFSGAGCIVIIPSLFSGAGCIVIIPSLFSGAGCIVIIPSLFSVCRMYRYNSKCVLCVLDVSL